MGCKGTTEDDSLPCSDHPQCLYSISVSGTAVEMIFTVSSIISGL